MDTIFNLSVQIDFELLKAQKEVLLNMQNKKTTTESEASAIEGIINLLDLIQDSAVEQGLNKYEVLNLSPNDDGSGLMTLKEARKIVTSKG